MALGGSAMVLRVCPECGVKFEASLSSSWAMLSAFNDHWRGHEPPITVEFPNQSWLPRPVWSGA